MFSAACAPPASNFLNPVVVGGSTSSDRFLYVASGFCYGGGVTTLQTSAANTIAKYNLTTGALVAVIADYTSSPGDHPAGLADATSDELYVAIENTGGGRRIETVNKRGTGTATWVVNSTALIANLRNVRTTSDGGLLVSRSSGASAIEKFSAAKARVLNGANPLILAPAGNCATSATFMTDGIELSNGNILFAHAAATPNNMIGIVNTGNTCQITAKIQGPTVTALPSALLYHTSGKLLVAYGSTTLASNFIYSYDVNLSTNAVTNPIAAYTNTSIVQGPSAMVQDPVSGDVYVASALSTFNTVEKFTFSASSGTLTRVGSTPFINASLYTRCISGLVVGY